MPKLENGMLVWARGKILKCTGVCRISGTCTGNLQIFAGICRYLQAVDGAEVWWRWDRVGRRMIRWRKCVNSRDGGMGSDPESFTHAYLLFLPYDLRKR